MRGTSEEVKMKGGHLLKNILGWVLAGIIAVVISSLFILVYNWSGTHIANPTGSTCYKWKPNQYKANATEGINYMHMDANGFNNLSDNTENIDLLLMGGSHMEAIQFPTSKNTASLLNASMPELRTYNIGMSGHQLLDCVDNIENAVEEFEPSRYVVIQTGDLLISLDSIVSVKQGTYADIPSYDSGIVYYLQMIPAIKVIYKQLDNKLAIDRKSKTHKHTSTEKTEAVKTDTRPIFTVLSEVLTEKRTFLEKHGCELIIAYTPSTKILSTGEMERDDNTEWVNQVKECCEDAGIVFLDCYDEFLAEYNNSYSVPYGFSNSKMGTGHLNETGHRMLAQVLEEYIKGDNR